MRRGQEVEEKNQNACKDTAQTKTRSYFFCCFFQDTNDLQHFGSLRAKKGIEFTNRAGNNLWSIKGKELFLSRTLPNIPNKVITCSY